MTILNPRTIEPAQHDGFVDIWKRHPERNNRHSSVWWFFLLTPKQPEGYGPKQMMFTLVSRAGDHVGINHRWHKGLTVDTQPQPMKSQLDGLAIGWINDGITLHENVVLEPGTIHLDQTGNVNLWTRQKDGNLYGGEMYKHDDKPFGTYAKFIGPKGYGEFEVWGDPQHFITSPENSLGYYTALGGAQVIAWKHLQFKGEFSSPSGTEYLEGAGYFQRVCMDFPAFPWKWIWAVFENESVFSCFVPYANLNALRRDSWFFPNAIESKSVTVKQSGYFSWGDTRETVEFDQITVTPYVDKKNAMPHFSVYCQSKQGDYLRYRFEPHNHANILMDRKILGGLRLSRYNYNEFLFKMLDLEGQIAGRPVNYQTVGNGWGNVEYTWGFGL